jgi:hypothetical protein
MYNVKGKNVSAVHQLYSNVSRGVALSSKTISKKKNAVALFLTTILPETLTKLLQLDDEESKFKELRDKNANLAYANLAIIFSGSYNGGENPISDSFTPYTMTEDSGNYTAIAKVNWQIHFPTIVMLQRNSKVEKSLLERFLTKNVSRLQGKSSRTPLLTPTHAEGTFASYYASATTNEDGDTFPDDTYESFSSKADDKTRMNRLEYGANEINNQSVREYTVQNDSTPRLGFAVILKTDNSNMELEFDMNLTISQPRQLKGSRGTHRWKVFQDLFVLDKIDIKIGDYVVVIGISNKGKIHVVDPSCHTSSLHMKEYTISSDIFASMCTIQQSPESL